MSTWIQEVGKPSVVVGDTYHVIDIGLLLENTWNPNELKDINFDKLKNDIEKEWSNQDQPVMIRPHPTEKWKYEIVDWAHRYKAMHDLWFEEIVVVIKELDDKEAKLKTISMNKLRGDFDSIRLAELLVDLRRNHWMSDLDIEEVLWFTEEELTGYDSLVDFDFESYEEELPEEITPDDTLGDIHEINIACTEEQKHAIEDAITMITDKGLIEQPGEALALLSKYFTTNEVKG